MNGAMYGYSVFIDKKTQYHKDVSYSQFIYRFNAIPIKNTVKYLGGVSNQILRFACKDETPRITILNEKN
jgi:hypothetical protein